MVHMDIINDEELNTAKSNNDFASLTPTSDSNSIILYPFAHQVGGHTQLLTLDKSTLCKPLIPRELLFYLNVPKELVKFVPAYKGVVQIRENGQGTYPPVVYQPLRSPKSPYSKYKPGLCRTDNLNEEYLSEDEVGQSVADMCGFPFELKVQIRPCPDEKILKKNLSQDNLLRAGYISRPNDKYLLLLENVASKYKLPCILDLKMGTRQHGDDATEEKRHRQIAKCQASTSASLGVRLCGMQVYQVDYGGFIWYDKYYGRKMDEDGLKRALQEYFRNGSQINGDIIDDVIDRLKLLSNAIEKSPSFRFYGTSLLIIHEGCTTSRNNNSKYNNSNNDNISNTATTTTSKKNITTNAPTNAANTTINSTTTTTNTNATINNNNNNKNSKSKRCQVDVRLIDFAHTICDCNYTNGRSSSSPSVLTSSSAEQLSSTASSMLAPLTISSTATAPRVAQSVVAPTTAINDAATIDNADIIISDDDDRHPNQSERLTNSESLLSHHHETNNHSPDSCLEEDLDLDSDLAIANDAGEDVVDAGCGVKVGLGAGMGVGVGIDDDSGGHDNDAHNDTENYHPNQRVSITSTSQESNIEYNNNTTNNNITAIISDNSSNNNGFNNAFNKPPIFKHAQTQPQLQPQQINRYHYSNSINHRHHLHDHHNYHHPLPHLPAAATLETLREVDQQIASSTKSKTSKQQISSTPTTPPSIGNRKISKTSIGPDKGLLFGLENLMRLLDDLKNETLLSY